MAAAARKRIIASPVSVQAIFRHGDRCPLRNGFLTRNSVEAGNVTKAKTEEEAKRSSPSQNATFSAEAEAATWKKLTAVEACSGILHDLEKSFPLRREHFQADESSTATDVPSFPFGALTARGLDQAISLGRKLKERYALCDSSSNPTFNIECKSSNYWRTQTTARGVLRGLSADSMQRNGNKVEIVVHPGDMCAIDSFSGMPIMVRMMKELADSDEQFRVMWEESASSRAELNDALPMFHGGQQFMWMYAFDQLECRMYHAKSFGNDPQTSPLLFADPDRQNELHLESRKQVEWRFRRWYEDESFRAVAIAPLLCEISCRVAMAIGKRREAEHLMSIVPLPSSTRERILSGREGDETEHHASLALYAAHDVTLCPLLAALGSWNGEWPDYASCVALEVYENAPAGSREASYTVCLYDIGSDSVLQEWDASAFLAKISASFESAIVNSSVHEALTSWARRSKL